MKTLFVALIILTSGLLFAESIDFDLEYKKVTHDYDLLESTRIDLEFGIGWYSTIIRYDDLGVAVVMDYEGKALFFYVYRKPGSTYEISRPIESIARTMIYTEVLDATSVVFGERE